MLEHRDLPSSGPFGTDRPTTLYIAPTKALAADQLRAVNSLGIGELRAATYDGDTPVESRDWVRHHSSYVLTNPDMLHRSILPGHPRWAGFLRGLNYVVVDECHRYRGVFGSHVAPCCGGCGGSASTTGVRRPSCSRRRPCPIRPRRPAG